MQKTSIRKGAFIALCLIGMLVLPAAAAPVTGQATTAKISAVDPGLKDELWANHQQYRLRQFDTNVERADSVITILGRYGVDTTASQATLTTISGKRSALENALTGRDKESLKSVNEELKTLWKQFRSGMKDALKARYGKGTTGLTPSITET